ncbi:polysaccharide lyase 8 family protein [Streptomyces sp. ISL-11]|uniref:polysaccharide lyase 8 family protein n=1 Tax=Streptomyces sp. ISL-11 TaxID=2819174 RepID=UPI001BE7A9FC|nr:polysaccharide lyase 8 family protein [Streptomyces sp. ISL-11]MBT2386324.1 polysaccharide lyase 8 family protein [Streptomyces sp. ISL-11]
MGFSPARDADPFAALRLRWRELMLGSGYDASAEPYAAVLRRTGELARTHRATMRPAPASLWPDAPFDPPAGITQSYARLHVMAQAYTQPGTGLTGDTGLAADVLAGLDHLHDRVYHPGTTPYGNWWEWQIGSPRLLLDTLTLLHDEAGPARRARHLDAVGHFVPDTVLRDYTGTSTGANRVDLCRVVALRGVLGADPARTALARDALSPVFPHVTRGDGLYADGSFVQHTWVAYSGTYGQVLLDGLGRLFALLRGSGWDVTDPARQLIHDSVENAYAPLIHNGLVMDSVSGRAISRGLQRADPRRLPQSDHQRGHALIAAVALLGEGASAAERTRWHALIKGWAERDTGTPLRTDPQFGVAELARVAAVLDAPAPAAPAPAGHRLFAAMDRAVHRRPGWVANISMASDRIAHYENGNGENPRGWHTGAGMLCWWGATTGQNQYADDFWPTVDPYRLPGITVSAKRLADNEGGGWGEPKPAARWVGGVGDGEFAIVGQHLRGLGSTLEARKAWLCADDAVVCLGAGITARDGTPVETVLDTRNLGERGAPLLTVDGEPQPRDTGWSRSYERAHWVHLEGHGGYVLPGGAPLTASRETRTGSWRDINSGGSPDRLTRRYLTLGHLHGTDPADASYVHLLMPGAGPRALAARAADPHWLTVVDNSRDRQAVCLPSLGLTAAAFWAPGAAGELAVTAPAAVLIRVRGRTATLHLSEPPRTGVPLDLTWSRPIRRVTAQDPSVRVLSTGEALRLRIAPGTAGAAHRCRVTLW